MGNVVAFDPKQLPARLQKAELSEVTKALMGGAGFSGKRLSIKGGVFRLLDAGKEIASIEERYLDVVFVNAAPKVHRTFFLKKYDGDTPEAPDCWSADGDTPDPKASARQSDTCANCPQNVKGSGENDSKACRYAQRVAVLLANDLEGDVLQLTVPAQSLFGKEEGDNRPLQAYVKFLALNKIDVQDVITRMKFDTTASHPKLFFKPMRYLTDDEAVITREKGQSEDAVKAVTFTVAERDNTPAKAAIPGTPPKAAAAPQQEAPAPKAQDEEPPAPAPKARGKKAEVKTAEVVEPQVRKEAAASTAGAKKSVADLAAAWDTDD